MTRTLYWYSISTFLIALATGTSPSCLAQQASRQERIFSSWDKNRDGALERSEVPPGPRRIFDKIDQNKDGKISLAEHLAGTGSAPSRPQTATDSQFQQHTIRQVWPQEPNGFNREFFVHVPASTPQSNRATTNRWPITFVFHGNGGSAQRTIGKWPRLFTDHLIVSPQGYQRSWNISNEKSKAPDVEFFRLILQELTKKYPQADTSRISLIGFSNGAGYIYRLLIELEEEAGIINAVPIVSSLLEDQYHDGSFWKRSDNSSPDYDLQAAPNGKRHILTVHGTADRVVPYQGGMRGRTAKHLSAQETAHALAKLQGYRGPRLPDDQGKPLGPDIIRYHYPEAQVTHLKIINGSHGLGPAGQKVHELLRDFISNNLP